MVHCDEPLKPERAQDIRMDCCIKPVPAEAVIRQ
jgi:hypothetical protein